MKKVEVILKVTESCNLKCKYCYNGTEQLKKGFLSLEKFEKFLKVLKTGYDRIHIIWHGGEPLLIGIDYFRRALDVERKVFINDSVIIENSVQTNGTLIDKEWIRLFKEHNIKVGISFDGVENDKYRAQSEKVLSSMKALKEAGLSFGCNAVVADDDYSLKDNYEFFKSQGVSFDFSMVINEGNAKDKLSLTSVSFADKMIKLFDEWIYDTKGVSVRTFATYLAVASGGRYRICSMCSCHMKYLSVFPDGTVYNCGRTNLQKYPFGKIDDFNSVNDVFSSKGALDLISGSIKRREKCKQSCELFSVCAGGCSDIAISENGLENIPANYCYVFKTVYKHVKKVYDEIIKNAVPLSELNPTVKTVLSRSLSKTYDSLNSEIAETY